MNRFAKYSLCAMLVVPIAAWLGCGEDDDDLGGDASFDAATLLNDYANNVVVATYEDLDAKAGMLLAAVHTLASDATASNLTAAQDAWVAARSPWELSEAFLFGPVDTDGLDPKLDSWPVNRVDLDAVLSSDQPLTKETADGLEETLKGFHTIEYLLFGEGGAKQSEDFDTREYEYLVAVTESLKADAQALHDAWHPSRANFAAEIANAGVSSAIYVSRKAAVQEIVNGMIVIADEVANGKISDPFNEEDARLVESQFSFNSIADFQDNIRGIQNAYVGRYVVDGQGLNDFVAERDADLDARFQNEVQAGIDAIGVIPAPFRDAIAGSRTEVQAAIDAVRAVQTTLESEILPLVLDATFE